jgi:hypothetical protein
MKPMLINANYEMLINEELRRQNTEYVCYLLGILSKVFLGLTLASALLLNGAAPVFMLMVKLMIDLGRSRIV